MIKNILIYSALGICSIALISGTLMSSGSPGKKTGSPLDGSTCVSCHTGSAVEVKENWISSDIPATGYKPKGVYTILIAAEDADAAKIGFELTAENAKSKVGTFKILEADKTTFTNAKAAVTHIDAGTKPTGGIAMWTVQWTAPDTDAGDITFYGAFNAANGNKNTSGDQIYTSKYTVKQDQTSTDVPNKATVVNAVYPNPSYGFVFVQSEHEMEAVLVYDVQGRLVKSEKTKSYNTKIDLSGLNNGNYLIKAVSSKGNFTKKVQLKN
jgi:hypothetical protein